MHRDLHSFPTRRSSDLRIERHNAGSSKVLALQQARSDNRDGNGLSQRVLVCGQEATTGRDHPGALTERSEEHTSELQSRRELVCRLLLEKKKTQAARSG